MTCAVAPDGGVYPCAFLCNPAFLAGNVTAERLEDIFKCSSVFEGFRRREVASCRSCDRFSVCHGGCPAVGYFLSGSPDLADPECLRAVAPAVAAPARYASQPAGEVV
jgi:radical SAM protein with 4Fe4S-binding SPASM domain